MASLANLLQQSRKARLSMVGTPIGNLSDASPRVIETLKDADVVLCEDTRVTAKLMHAFNITCELERCDDNVIQKRKASVMDRLAAGQHVAFVSDAGMPGVSDPGQVLVDEALNQGFEVEVIPGPSAVTCALVATGFAMGKFFFEGFLPRKANQKLERLRLLSAIPGALVFYESPHRVVDTLTAIAEVFPQRQAALVRELTKVHEEVVRDTTANLRDIISQREQIKGECVIVVTAPTQSEFEALLVAQRQDTQEQTLDEAIAEGLAQGSPKSALARSLSRRYGLDRQDVYNRINEIARQ